MEGVTLVSRRSCRCDSSDLRPVTVLFTSMGWSWCRSEVAARTVDTEREDRQ